MSDVNEFLAQLFRSHGIEAVLRDGWLTFTNQTVRAQAAIIQERQEQNGKTVQLDVRLAIPQGRTIIESFAGLGQSRDEAIADALRNFTTNSFHVLLAAFFRSPDPQVTQEEWLVGGRTSHVVIGGVGVRGQPPVQGKPLVAWFEQLQEAVKALPLRPGTHWLRLYYSQMRSQPLALEVLLDNDECAEVQSAMAHVVWPSGEAFYSVRVFLVLQVAKSGAVDAPTAATWLAEIVAPWPEFTEDEVHAAMVEAGVPETLAHRAYLFTQMAWGREIVVRLGVQPSPEYTCLNAAGEIVESGQLANEPCFAMACQLVKRYAGWPGFKHLSLMSASVNAVNQALLNGSKPQDLVMSRSVMFLEAPSRAGMANAQKAIVASSAPAQAKPATTKSWWRFW